LKQDNEWIKQTLKEVLEADPRQQGLKPTPKTIRTPGTTVLEANPEQQGLKLQLVRDFDQTAHVQEADPEQQGRIGTGPAAPPPSALEDQGRFATKMRCGAINIGRPAYRIMK
jgi:hypothetical protein